MLLTNRYYFILFFGWRPVGYLIGGFTPIFHTLTVLIALYSLNPCRTT